MKLRIFFWILLVFLGAFVLFGTEAMLMQRSLSSKTLRLHVVANSDSPEDQSQKLRLRDHILKELELITQNCHSLDETESALIQKLDSLQASAQSFLYKEGSHYSVSVTLCEEVFSTRNYTSFRLPAGRYHSLRIRIGNGEGKNWWCVVFPSLCNAPTQDSLQDYAAVGGYNEEECQFIQREEPRYAMRFKLLEWINKFTSR